MKKPSLSEIMAARTGPTSDLDERWQQRVHQICGGELVVITKQGQEAICCKKCRAMWTELKNHIDWSVPKPEKVGPALWVPGKI